jgi:hypothetical protein
MTLSTYLSSGTPADGTAATAANTGVISGGFVLGSGSTATWRAAQGNRGERGLQFVSTGTASSTVRWAMAASNAKAAFTGVLTTPLNAPSNVVTVLNLRQTGGVAGRLQWNAAGELYVFDLNNTTRGLVPAGVLALNTQYVVQMLMTSPSNTTGTLAMRVLSMGGTQLAEVFASNANFSSNPFLQFDVFPGGSAGTYGWGDLQMDDGRTSYIPPIASSVSYSGSLDLSGTGTLNIDGSPALQSGASFDGSGQQTRSSSIALTAALNDSSAVSTSYAGTTSFADQLDLDALGNLHLSGAPSLASLVDLSGTATLSVAGRLSHALNPRRYSISTPGNSANIRYSNNHRQEVQVP